MLRYALLTVAIVLTGGAQPLAQEVGRYQIVTVPLGIEGESGGTTVLLDTQTGRTWHVILDDKGRPRWRGIELAGGSQALAEAPGQRRTDEELQPGEETPAEEAPAEETPAEEAPQAEEQN